MVSRVRLRKETNLGLPFTLEKNRGKIQSTLGWGAHLPGHSLLRVKGRSLIYIQDKANRVFECCCHRDSERCY